MLTRPKTLNIHSSNFFDFTTLLTSRIISVAFYSEREKSDKFCSEALILVWSSCTCLQSTTRDLRLYFPSEGSHTHDFYALKKIHRTRPSLNPRTSDPVGSMITTGPPGSTSLLLEPVSDDGLVQRKTGISKFLFSMQKTKLSFCVTVQILQA